MNRRAVLALPLIAAFPNALHAQPLADAAGDILDEAAEAVAGYLKDLP